MPYPALEPALHAQPVILYIAVPFGFPFGLACADRMYIPIGGKAPSVRYPLRCIPVFRMGAPGCCACKVVRCLCSRPLASGLDRFVGCPACCVSCCAMLRGSGGVCVRVSGQFPEVRVVWLGDTPAFSVAWPFSGPPDVVAAKRVRCPGVQLSRRPRALVLVSYLSLNPLPLDITCSQAMCPDVGTPCALPWAPRDLLPWCMIFSEVMPAGGTFVPGPPPWEVTYSRLTCSRVGEPRMARRAGLGVTFPCLPAGAGGLEGPMCWTASPGQPLVWLVRKGGQAKG